MTTDADTGAESAPDPMEDAETWEELSREEQSDRLDEGLADMRGESGDGAWRHLDEGEQTRTISAIERGDGGQPRAQEDLSETEKAMQAALEETWTAEVFADLDDVPTVPFECRELDAAEQQTIQEAFRVMSDLEAQGEQLQDGRDVDAADLEAELDIDSDTFDSPSDLEEWVTWLLADITVDDAFDEKRFRSGRGLRTNTRKLLFMEIALRYHEESERAMKFRTER